MVRKMLEAREDGVAEWRGSRHGCLDVWSGILKGSLAPTVAKKPIEFG